MFKASIDTTRLDQIRQGLAAAGRDFQGEQANVLEAVGVQTLGYARLDFVTKSRGGTGSDGTTWAPLEESTVKRKANKGSAKRQKNRQTTKSGKARPTGNKVAIGIDAGLLLNSSQPGFSGNMTVDQTGVTVGFPRSYAKYFDEKRPLLPIRLPDAWRDGLQAIVNRWAETVLGQKLS